MRKNFIKKTGGISGMIYTARKLTPEGAVIRGVRKYLEFHGWMVTRNQQSLGCVRGRPDLEALKNGLTIYIECKSPKGGLRKGQPEYHQRLRNHGALVFVTDDPEQFSQELERLQNKLWPGKNRERER